MDNKSLLDEHLRRVAVVGAAGKMGRGIAVLLLQEMARLEAEKSGQVGTGMFILILVDADENRLNALWSYFKPQLTKFAIQNINLLRRFFSDREDLIENSDMIHAFVEGAHSIVRDSTELTVTKGALLVFEAVAEEIAVKRKIYQTLNAFLGPSTYYLTNTSSIPISKLAKEAGIEQRLIGFHFYNPPPLQKLVELIPAEPIETKLVLLAHELGKRLNKIVVLARDVAGFIGNGHFIRELAYASKRVELLSKNSTFQQAVFIINWVTQRLLMRPMGIFQLIDFVGLDICHHIMQVMKEYLSDKSLHSVWLDTLISQGVRGGQTENGQALPGFFIYEKNLPVGIYSLESNRYEPLAVMDYPLPDGVEAWSSLKKAVNRHEKLQVYFTALFSLESPPAQEAVSYLLYSKKIAEQLVQSGVARTVEDVNTVLELGFSHLYGAVNPYY